MEGVHKALLFTEVYGSAVVWDVWVELVALFHRTPFLFEKMTDRKGMVIQSRIFEWNEPATLRKMTESILFQYLSFQAKMVTLENMVFTKVKLTASLNVSEDFNKYDLKKY